MRKKELIERDAEELMQEAASDELFLADLNETMEDSGLADQEDHAGSVSFLICKGHLRHQYADKAAINSPSLNAFSS